MIVKKKFSKLREEFDFELTDECYDALTIDTAVTLLKHFISTGSTIYYGELAKQMTTPVEPINLNAPLGHISNACKENGLPLLSAIVINKESEMPGDGFFRYFYPQAKEDEWLEIYLKDFKKVSAYMHWDKVLKIFKGEV